MIKLAAEKGMDSIKANIYSFNAQSQRMFESVGFYKVDKEVPYMKLKIAFLQLVPDGTIEDNMQKGIKACREAREKGADIALFPEMWSSGYVFPHNEKWLEQNSVSLDSMYVKKFSETA